jgi:outer membrane protein assembly complex protein YaeT
MKQCSPTANSVYPIRSKFKRIVHILGMVLLCMTATRAAAWGTGNFKVDAIQISGLRGLSQKAVLHQLPLQVGDWFDESKSEELIKRLYATQWFEEVKLTRRGARLEVAVVERPIISQVIFKGNHGIPEDSLDKMLREFGLAGGEFFNPSTLEFLKKSLIHGYAEAGKYAAKIESSVIKQSEGIVKILVNIDPGATLQFTSIRLLGSQAFTEKRLLAALPVTSNRWWGLIEGKLVHCTATTRKQALIALQRFYENQGYADIKIKADQLIVTADRRHADWIIELTEGPIYKIGHYRILGETYGLTEEHLKTLIRFKSGDTYSKRAILRTEHEMKRHFGKEGYISANVSLVPHFDRKKNCVNFSIQIERGEKTYVRHINILGNQYIQDRVLRHFVLQQEASVASVDDIDDSKQNLLQSGLVEQANIEHVQVIRAKDQVDLDVHISEPARKVSMTPLGFDFGADGSRWHTDFGVENPFGTGEDIHFKMKKFARDISTELSYKKKIADVFGLQGVKYHIRAHYHNANWTSKAFGNFFNQSPYVRSMQDHTYYLGDCVGYLYGSMKSYLQTTFAHATSDTTGLPSSSNETPDSRQAQNDAQSTENEQSEPPIERAQFDFDSWGGRFYLDLPRGKLGDFWQIGAELRSRSFHLPDKGKRQKISTQITDFLDQYGGQVYQGILRGGRYARQLKGSNLYFPTGGSESNFLVSLALTQIGKSGILENGLRSWWKTTQPLHYFKIDYSGSHFWNLVAEDSLRDHIFGLRWHLGMGQRFSGGSLPFFDTYYSGRFYGYQDDSLGPQDSLKKMLGGSLLMKAQIQYCVPKPFSGDFLPIARIAWPYRSSIFLQVGNVYEFNNISSLLKKKYTDFPVALSGGVAFELLLRVPMLGVFPGYVSLSVPILSGKVSSEQDDKLSGKKERTQYFNIGLSFGLD